MKCPHCLTDFHDHPEVLPMGKDPDGHWAVIRRACSACDKMILVLASGRVYESNRGYEIESIKQQYLIRPKTANRTPPSPHVPQAYAKDYVEACLVLGDSAKASGALSRRCLQSVLREEAKIKHGNLADEIQQVIDGRNLPSHLAESLDAIRNIGNFAAHPMKSKSSGEIVEVEAGEAEWNLDVLDSLFDFFFVQPAILKEKRAALNKKLADAGKPPMK